MPKHPDTPQAFLQNEVYMTIYKRIEFHAALLKTIKAGLPEMLANQCSHCVVKEGGVVVIFTESQSVASQLRFYAPAILMKLNADPQHSFRKVFVKLLDPPEPAVEIKPMNPVSYRTVEMVRASIHSEPEDQLTMALTRLSDTMERYAKD